MALDTAAWGDAVICALGCTKPAGGTWWQAAAGTCSSTLQAGVGMNQREHPAAVQLGEGAGESTCEGLCAPEIALPPSP